MKKYLKHKIGRIKYILTNKTIKFDLNTLFYLYKRNKWMFDISRFLNNFEQVSIKKPIFLLGTQGGGLTLISRVLRRNKQVVSVTGNYKYWAGADEMNSVLGPILPTPLKGVEYIPPLQDVKIMSGWICGLNKHLDKFRNTSQDVTPEIKRRFKEILRWIIQKHAKCKNPRFIDKSQTYTIKIPLINELLNDNNPHFILITRNPYAICYRAAIGRTYKEFLNKDYNLNQRLKMACQHWSNYMNTAFKDSKKISNFMHIKFENFLKKPSKITKQICNFADLNYSPKMLPQPNDKLPLGSVRGQRWYPLRTNVNKKYLLQLKPKQIQIIKQHCGELAKQFNYHPPKF